MRVTVVKEDISYPHRSLKQESCHAGPLKKTRVRQEVAGRKEGSQPEPFPGTGGRGWVSRHGAGQFEDLCRLRAHSYPSGLGVV
jgi:hypothetical protein